jgi:hypothetical protein
MTELTIETLIKIVIGVVVLVAVILGLYLSMTTYVIPFFKGFGFNSTEQFNLGAGEEVCAGKVSLGYISLLGGHYYFYENNNKKPTNIFFAVDGYVKYKGRILSSKIGKVNGYIIEIFNDYKTSGYTPAYLIDGAYIGGRQVCR